MASVHNVATTQQDAISSGQQRKQTATTQNVGQAERWVSAIGGGALLVYGIARLDWLGAGIGLFGSGLLYRGVTGHSFTYQAVNFNTAQQRSPTVMEIPGKKGFRVQRALTINRSPEELYEFWSDVEKTPLYTPGISSVTKTGERTSHWVAQGPFGRSVEWNGELLEDLPAKGIAWHVHGKPTTANAGRVHFEADAGGRGTVTTLTLDYFPSEGPFWTNFGRLSSKATEMQALETLRRFKELMEAGEIPTTQGQPTGKGRK
jgi:uncharacterized membrane protein